MWKERGCLRLVVNFTTSFLFICNEKNLKRNANGKKKPNRFQSKTLILFGRMDTMLETRILSVSQDGCQMVATSEGRWKWILNKRTPLCRKQKCINKWIQEKNQCFWIYFFDPKTWNRWRWRRNLEWRSHKSWCIYYPPMVISLL